MELDQAIVVAGELAVRFADGAELYIPLPFLRANCPCAACQQKIETLARNGIKAVPASGDSLTAIDVIGGYAIRLSWQDGHATGIYSYSFLRDLEEDYRKSIAG